MLTDLQVPESCQLGGLLQDGLTTVHVRIPVDSILLDRTEELRGYWVPSSHYYYWLQDPLVKDDNYLQVFRAPLACLAQVFEIFASDEGSQYAEKTVIQVHKETNGFDRNLMVQLKNHIRPHVDGFRDYLTPGCKFLSSYRSMKPQRELSMEEVLQLTITAERKRKMWPWGEPKHALEGSPEKPSDPNVRNLAQSTTSSPDNHAPAAKAPVVKRKAKKESSIGGKAKKEPSTDGKRAKKKESSALLMATASSKKTQPEVDTATNTSRMKMPSKVRNNGKPMTLRDVPAAASLAKKKTPTVSVKANSFSSLCKVAENSGPVPRKKRPVTADHVRKEGSPPSMKRMKTINGGSETTAAPQHEGNRNESVGKIPRKKKSSLKTAESVDGDRNQQPICVDLGNVPRKQKPKPAEPCLPIDASNRAHSKGLEKTIPTAKEKELPSSQSTLVDTSARSQQNNPENTKERVGDGPKSGWGSSGWASAGSSGRQAAGGSGTRSLRPHSSSTNHDDEDEKSGWVTSNAGWGCASQKSSDTGWGNPARSEGSYSQDSGTRSGWPSSLSVQGGEQQRSIGGHRSGWSASNRGRSAIPKAKLGASAENYYGPSNSRSDQGNERPSQSVSRSSSTKWSIYGPGDHAELRKMGRKKLRGSQDRDLRVETSSEWSSQRSNATSERGRGRRSSTSDQHFRKPAKSNRSDPVKLGSSGNGSDGSTLASNPTASSAASRRRDPDSTYADARERLENRSIDHRYNSDRMSKAIGELKGFLAAEPPTRDGIHSAWSTVRAFGLRLASPDAAKSAFSLSLEKPDADFEFCLVLVEVVYQAFLTKETSITRVFVDQTGRGIKNMAVLLFDKWFKRVFRQLRKCSSDHDTSLDSAYLLMGSYVELLTVFPWEHESMGVDLTVCLNEVR